MTWLTDIWTIYINTRIILKPKKSKFASHFPIFLFSEISRLQAGGSKGAGFKDPIKYVDVYRERPIRLTVRVLVPVREHPKVSIKNHT